MAILLGCGLPWPAISKYFSAASGLLATFAVRKICTNVLSSKKEKIKIKVDTTSTNLGNKKTNVLKRQNSYLPGGGIGYMPRLISTNERPNDHKSLDTEYWEPCKKKF